MIAVADLEDGENTIDLQLTVDGRTFNLALSITQQAGSYMIVYSNVYVWNFEVQRAQFFFYCSSIISLQHWLIVAYRSQMMDSSSYWSVQATVLTMLVLFLTLSMVHLSYLDVSLCLRYYTPCTQALHQ